jgi:hypothetical protein
MVDDRPVSSLIPPDTVAPLPLGPLQLPALPTIADDTGLVIGVAAV